MEFSSSSLSSLVDEMIVLLASSSSSFGTMHSSCTKQKQQQAVEEAVEEEEVSSMICTVCQHSLKAQMLRVIQKVQSQCKGNCGDVDCQGTTKHEIGYSNNNENDQENIGKDCTNVDKDGDYVPLMNVRKSRTKRGRRSLATINGEIVLSHEVACDTSKEEEKRGGDVKQNGKDVRSNKYQANKSSTVNQDELSKIPKLRRKSRRTSVLNRWPDLYSDEISNKHSVDDGPYQLSNLDNLLLGGTVNNSKRMRGEVDSNRTNEEGALLLESSLSNNKLESPSSRNFLREQDLKSSHITTEYLRKSPASPNSMDISIEIDNQVNSSAELQLLPSDQNNFILGNITPQIIDAGVAEIYGDNILQSNCMLPRVFVSLLKVKPSSLTIHFSLTRLLKALVDTEYSMLNFAAVNQPNRDGFSERIVSRQVTFQSFDFSSVSPPIDKELGSDLQTNQCISSIEKVLKCANEICKMSPCDNVITLLKYFVEFFEMLSNQELHNKSIIIDAIAESMQSKCKQPLIRLGQFYKSEFLELLNVVSHSHKALGDVPFYGIRQQAGILLRSSIRYKLRRKFNSIPPHFTSSLSTKFPHKLHDHAMCRSKVHEIVSMAPNSEADKSWSDVIGDGSVSSVINAALQQIYLFFVTCQRDTSPSKSYFGICRDIQPYDLSRSTLAGYNRGSDVLEDFVMIGDILNDIDNLLLTISASNSIDFLLSLFRWPGVNQAINDCGGWGDVEAVASSIASLNITVADEFIAHFTLLQSIENLLNSLEISRSRMTQLSQEAQYNLKKIWTRFRCGSNKAKVSRNEIVRAIKLKLTRWKASTCMPRLQKFDQSFV